MSTLDDAIKQWRLPELLTAWLAYQMPEYNDGLPYWNNLELAKIGRGLRVANSRIVELETEIRRLRVRLAIANISTDADPQEIRDRQIERENKWFHKEEQVENLKADNAELRDTVRALTAELHAANNRTMQAVKDGEGVGL